MSDDRYKRLLRQMLSKSEHDRIGGASLVSEFLEVYQNLSDQERQMLGASVLDIIRAEEGEELTAMVWLAGALAANEVILPNVADLLKARLAEVERRRNTDETTILKEELTESLRLVEMKRKR